ncbi:hypothetical protein CAPTEDRAFT_228754 [Capitella teleta]|uniref:RBR-type E3 ubiquitin transferase n=1 Tax=Capitella teleta TaxID=283909 RepID=R7TPI0_CAPTE|nr:hypothetical protein CAPTEDRAFT_228754 [Capitella teleta]|eukprot:ELT95569.1 hypothetical protein CAPTEDRAFT_228754 [Capitella teleta]
MSSRLTLPARKMLVEHLCSASVLGINNEIKQWTAFKDCFSVVWLQGTVQEVNEQSDSFQLDDGSGVAMVTKVSTVHPGCPKPVSDTGTTVLIPYSQNFLAVMATEEDTRPECWPMNLAEQQDELCALESIFADDGALSVSVIPSEAEGEGGASVDTPEIGTQYALQLLIPVHQSTLILHILMPYDEEEPDAAASAAANGQQKPEFSRSESGKRWHTSVQVEHLPPLVLQVTLPWDYPSASPPVFTLSSLWLGSKALSSICQQLDKLWENGMPVLYAWYAWLQNESMAFLGIQDELKLMTLDEEKDLQVCRDFRALPEFNDLQRDLTSLVRFDYEKRRRVFCQSMHTCGICFDEKLGSEFFLISECQHHFCRDCLTSYCQMHVRDGTVTQLRCPQDECKVSLPHPVLANVLGQEELIRLERLQLERALDAMDDVQWCPRCMFPVILEDDGKFGSCTKCFFTFCVRCKDAWHQGLPCKTDVARLAEIEKKIAEARERDKSNAEKMRMIKMELESYETVRKISQPCPKCRAPIEKNEGCHHVVCTNCHTHMCYRCGAAIRGYDHFQSSCELFDVDNIPVRNRIQPAINERLIGIQVELRVDPMAHERLVQCPRCRQRNMKEARNNHMRCWACRANFCFLCKNIFVKLQEHFIMGGCPQHSG